MRDDWTKKELEEKYVNAMKAITVPVNLHLEGKQHFLDFSQIKKILEGAKMIALGECGCRKDLGHCDSPLDVCLSLDIEAEDMIKNDQAKEVDIKEALNALKRSHDAGLVHIAYIFKGSDKPGIICSCCSCCCHSMSALIRFGIPEAVVASKFVASQDIEKCINCGLCVDRCQFKARRLSEEKLVYDQAKCFGCGLCVSKCPTNAISLIKRS